MQTSAINKYLKKVNKHYQSGEARELTYRGDFASLIEELAPGVDVTNEPKAQPWGQPDFILNRKGVPVGFIETKDIGKDLNSEAYKEQFDRYKKAMSNLIITDYLEFHFYRGETLMDKIAIAKVVGGKIKSIPDNFKNFEVLFKDFCDHVGQTIKSPKALAEKMAGKAILLGIALNKALSFDEKNKPDTELYEQYTAFKDILIKDLTKSKFADIYAQTLAYGMFSARWHDPTLDTFSREEAARLIPKSNPFLRKLFDHVSGINIDERIRIQVEDLANLFRATDIRELLKDFGKETKTQDPIFHFYETFLTAYNPELRKSKGVYYTPEPVVDFITRGVDDILKTEFNLSEGLADIGQVTIKSGDTTKEVHKVQVLDPATGTGTFLAAVVKLIHQKKSKSTKGGWGSYVEDHLIPRLNGFEVMMAPYAMAHLKLDMMLRGTEQRRASSSAERAPAQSELQRRASSSAERAPAQSELQRRAGEYHNTRQQSTL